MKRFRLFAFAAAAATALTLSGCAGDIVVSEVGSYHVGGRQVTLTGLPTQEIVFSPGAPPLKVDPNGDFEVEQMYVHYTKLAQPKGKVPLLLWHGGGLAGVTWETKPDGKPGWEMYFLKAGWDTYVSDAVERGRASWARFPQIFTTEPMFRTKKEGWELFRIGKTYATDPKQRVANAGTQFPVESFDQFVKQGIPRWVSNDGVTQKAYDAYVQKACPCVIVVHSQGGNFGIQAALNNPDKVKALVLVEPSGTPDPAKTDISALKNIPMLWVWGDYIDALPFWTGIFNKQESFRAEVNKLGGKTTVIKLPEAGIKGNSHMLMMDRNSDQIAGLVQNWLVSQGLTK